MTNPPRRHILRANARQQGSVRPRTSRVERWSAQLANDRQSLKRWLTRLKRATNTVTQLHQRICRLERQIREANRDSA